MLKFFEGKNVAITDKVLILGESHYPASKEEYKKEIQDNVTSIVMEQFFNNVDNYPFFTRIALSFGFDNHDEAVEFFNKVYFGNYIVHYAAKGNHTIGKKLIAEYQEQYNDRLFNFVNEQHIKTIFCFSKNVYYGLPGNNAFDLRFDDVRINNNEAKRARTINKYIYRQGVEHAKCNVKLDNDLTVYGIAHPSGSKGYSPKEVYK